MIWFSGIMFFAASSDPGRGASPDPSSTADAPAGAEPKAVRAVAPTEKSPGGPIPDSDDDQVGREVRDTLSKLLPWAVSLVGHVALVVIAIVTVFWIGELQVEDETPIIPSIRLSDNPGSPLEMSLTEQLEDSSATRSVVTATNTSVTPSEVQFEAPAFALTGGGGAPAGNPFANQGLGEGLSTGFFGQGGNAQSVVFVIDASGSLVDTYPFVIEELKRSILELTDQQSFQVVFFTGLADEPVFARGEDRRMYPATQANKRMVIDWIDLDSHNVEIGGQGNPVAGIQSGLSLEPELIYLLSDNITGSGKYEIQRDRLIRAVRDANVNGTKINTIQFLYPDRLNPNEEEKWTLFRIARDSGGRFKFVDAQELNLQ